MVRRFGFLALVPLVLSFVSICHAASWYVDGSVASSGDGRSWATAVRTIQEGIDKSSSGDAVNVAQGIYVENIHFHGRNILLRSTNPTDPAVVAATIIDGNDAGPVVTFLTTENPSCFLSGFTIRNGRAARGGGVCGNGGHATIQFNLIGLNEATAEGGGLWACDGLVTGNIITRNSAGDSGGGISKSYGRIVNNMITQNSAESTGGGLAESGEEIRGNTIRRNSADHGGGLYRCFGLIQDNLISGNEAAFYGGGTYNCITLVNNTIVANSATAGGGGVAGEMHVSAEIANCIIWGNEADEDPQTYLVSNPTYCCIQDWTGGGTGNVTLDPDFVDPNGPDGDPSTTWDNDYRLTASSVCIDRGNNDAHAFPRLDKDGNLRIAYGSFSLTIDMGAFEYNSKRFAIAEVAPVAENSLTLTWNSQPGNSYTLWFREDASTLAWVEGPTIASQGASTLYTVPVGASRTGYCIVQMVE